MACVISTGGAERAEETFCEKGHFGAQSEKTPVRSGPLSSASNQLARGHSARSLAPPHCPPPTVDHSPLSLTGCWVTSPRGSKILFQRVTVATATWPRRSLVATGGLGWMQEISVLAKKGRTQPQGLRPVGTGGFAEELGPHDASSPLPAQAWPQFIAPAPPCREPAVTHTGGW